MIVTNIEQILPRIKNKSIIAVDGINGAGKTTFALSLVRKIGGQCLSLDDYLIRPFTDYVRDISYDRLVTKISSVVKREERIVIEGLCIQSVLKNINRTPDVIIYVDCVTPSKYPELTRRTSDIQFDNSIPQANFVSAQIHEYHLRHDAMNSADIIYEWEDDPLQDAPTATLRS